MIANAAIVTTCSDAAFSAKLHKLRDESLNPADVRALVHDLTLIIAKDAIAAPSPDEQVATFVILRSGLAMSDAFVSQLPKASSRVIYHLGLFRERETLQPIEYYNKLGSKDPRIKRAYVLDPVIATGGTAIAVINILRCVDVYRQT